MYIIKNYSDYRPPAKDNLSWSGQKIFQVQLDEEGTNVLITDLQRNTLSCRLIVRNRLNPLNEFKEERYSISGKDIDVNRGYNVYYSDENYIVNVDIDLENPFYNTLKMRRCNNKIVRQDKDLNTVEVPCIFEKTTFSSGSDIKETKYTRYKDGEKIIIVPNNLDTFEIKEEQRFIFNNSQKEIYKVVNIESLEQPGVLVLYLEQDITLQSTDRLDLNIANYKEPTVTEISGSDTINRLSLQSYTTDIDVTWTISNGNTEIISQDINTITLKGLISGNVVLSADDGTTVYTKDIEVLESLF